MDATFNGESSSPIEDVWSVRLLIWPIKQITMLDGRALLPYETLCKNNGTYDMHNGDTIFTKPLSRNKSITL